MLLPIAITAVVTLFVTTLYLNLRSSEKQIRYELEHRFAAGSEDFIRIMNHLLGPAMLPGNRLTALQNGDEIFPAMLGAIRDSRESITFETYNYWSGEVGRQFSEALSAAS